MTPEQRDILITEWGEAVYLAREDYTVDPHQHIERLAATGDQLADALRAALVERTCGTCQHADTLESPAGSVYCTLPGSWLSARRMPAEARCKDWAAKGDEA